jgi:aminoglycoside 6'-N-acetyltransferase I
MRSSDQVQVQALARSLWPDAAPYKFRGEHVFVWERASGTLGGFASISIRARVDGSDSEPCPHVEGWYVEPDLRRSGVGRALLAAIETWCRAQGFSEFTSDTEIANEISIRAHAAVGFEPTEQIQYFKKTISKRP